MGLAIDTKNDEIWVVNFGDHAALAFSRGDDGDQPPKRIIRSAPAGTPSAGFGNPMAVAYEGGRFSSGLVTWRKSSVATWV